MSESEYYRDAPSEIRPSLVRFRKSLDEVEEILKPFFDGSIHNVQEKMTALEKAKTVLVSLYAINSLFWMYLCTQGVDTKEHPIKHELARVQQYMRKLKQITDKQKAAKLDKSAAKRFVKSALYDHKDKSPKRKSSSQEGGPDPKKR